jgi:predicted DNA-binding antitoxin AbrB/MazE fold protein
MNRTVSAIFENGVFRPTESVALTEGSKVELTVHTPDAASRNGSAAETLARIAALPVEGDRNPFSGADHDSVLYGKHGAR